MLDKEMNRVLSMHVHEVMPKDEKRIIDSQAKQISYMTRRDSNDRAKIGRASSLEILYKLGRFLNKEG